MDEFLKSNREMWDKLTPIHAQSEFYDVDGFKSGKCTLQPVEVEELGDVIGKSLLHLQCHFGMDTMSWARRGATVTGADFSEEAVNLAQSLADELSIPAKFVCCDLYDLPKHFDDKFEIVYTGGGVLTWLPDLTEWGRVIAHFLKQGGKFYIREFHPFAYIFDDDEGVKAPRIRYPYFHQEKPLRFDDEGSYADKDADTQNVNYEWPHSMSDIINSLISAGLKIEWLHEFPHASYQSHPFLKQGEDGLWRYDKIPGGLPLMFSIMATKL